MHLWFLHKRLISDKADNHAALLVQEELFDIFWDDTQKRIREQGVAELTVNKHLNDVQQYTFQHLTHYDHTFSEFELKPKARFEELCGVFWVHVLNREEDFCSDQVQRMAYYIDTQYNNIMNRLPETYWREGRLAWVDLPDFSKMRDNQGKIMPEVPVDEEDVLPDGWYKALSTAGESYYWNPSAIKSQWERPKSS
jgi:cytochrome b pre-mRNA-processing protein 3